MLETTTSVQTGNTVKLKVTVAVKSLRNQREESKCYRCIWITRRKTPNAEKKQTRTQTYRVFLNDKF